MRTQAVSALVALVTFASSASGAIPRHGTYVCALGGQGGCGEVPEGVCLGNMIRSGKPTIFLRLDFDQNRADLNGIDGRILRNPATGRDEILWGLHLLGSPSIAMDDENGTTVAGLRYEGHTADFICRRDP